MTSDHLAWHTRGAIDSPAAGIAWFRGGARTTIGAAFRGEHFLALVAGDGFLPDDEAAVLQACLGGLDLSLLTSAGTFSEIETMSDRAFFDAPPGVKAALPRAVERVQRRVPHSVRRFASQPEIK